MIIDKFDFKNNNNVYPLMFTVNNFKKAKGDNELFIKVIEKLASSCANINERHRTNDYDLTYKTPFNVLCNLKTDYNENIFNLLQFLVSKGGNINHFINKESPVNKIVSQSSKNVENNEFVYKILQFFIENGANLHLGKSPISSCIISNRRYNMSSTSRTVN